ncbi:MAG: JAB domain-containing protein [Acidobacteriota bacterium]|nr:JAB domain-containing protein [Acidobacteriota bacterium]
MTGSFKTVQSVRICQVRDGGIRFAVDRITSPADVYAAVREYYRGADREILSVLCLDSRHAPVCFHVASVGTLNTTRTRAAEIVKPAILSNASAVLLIHNHPSGDLEPSPDDVAFTRNLRQACELLGLTLHDHLVIGDNGFISLRARGLI